MVNDAIANPNKDKQTQNREHRNERNTFVLHVRVHMLQPVFYIFGVFYKFTFGQLCQNVSL